jgi:hypothetical protein
MNTLDDPNGEAKKIELPTLNDWGERSLTDHLSLTFAVVELTVPFTPC